jgi:hypothetical protein|tara:strand:- start:1418 stop:1699 length:282 start_codon:yes stop_codon:yes gene_type:complete
MIYESQPMIELIMKELRILQGEITLAKSLFAQRNEEIPEPKSMIELVKVAQEQATIFGEFMKIMNYNEGKFDAYINILKQLGVEYNRNETETE